MNFATSNEWFFCNEQLFQRATSDFLRANSAKSNEQFLQQVTSDEWISVSTSNEHRVKSYVLLKSCSNFALILKMKKKTAELYSESFQASKMKLFEKIVNGWKLLAIFTKSSILDLRHGFAYSSELSKIIESTQTFASPCQYFNVFCVELSLRFTT